MAWPPPPLPPLQGPQSTGTPFNAAPVAQFNGSPYTYYQQRNGQESYTFGQTPGNDSSIGGFANGDPRTVNYQSSGYGVALPPQEAFSNPYGQSDYTVHYGHDSPSTLMPPTVPSTAPISFPPIPPASNTYPNGSFVPFPSHQNPPLLPDAQTTASAEEGNGPSFMVGSNSVPDLEDGEISNGELSNSIDDMYAQTPEAQVTLLRDPQGMLASASQGTDSAMVATEQSPYPNEGKARCVGKSCGHADKVFAYI